MSDWLAMAILAVLQGITEFLPVSSSGHLVLAHHVINLPTPGLLTDIVLHVGSLVAVLVFYRRALVELALSIGPGLRALRREGWSAAMALPDFARLLYLGVATVITGVIGLSLEDWVENAMRTPLAVGLALLVNGAILMSAPRQLRSGTPSLGKAALIGIAQGLAVTPGISRSGSTITAALHLGWTGRDAARFSFLLSIPAILGALLLHLRKLDGVAGENLALMAFGAALAGLSGYVALKLLVALLDRARFHHFAWYCWALGACAVAWGLLG